MLILQTTAFVASLLIYYYSPVARSPQACR
jgi:hypothetical protein